MHGRGFGILFIVNIVVYIYNIKVAEIAQSVEHFTRNEGVVGSNPIFSFSRFTGM